LRPHPKGALLWGGGWLIMTQFTTRTSLSLQSSPPPKWQLRLRVGGTGWGQEIGPSFPPAPKPPHHHSGEEIDADNDLTLGPLCDFCGLDSGDHQQKFTLGQEELFPLASTYPVHKGEDFSLKNPQYQAQTQIREDEKIAPLLLPSARDKPGPLGQDGEAKDQGRRSAPPPSMGVGACPFCYECWHLGAAGKRQVGALIWRPELSQPFLSRLAAALFLAQSQEERLTPQIHRLDSALKSRSCELVAALQIDTLKDFVEAYERLSYAAQKALARRLYGVRYWPNLNQITDEESHLSAIIEYWRDYGSFKDYKLSQWPEYLHIWNNKIF
jgi:hypothetical protein